MDLPPVLDVLPTQFPAYIELHRDVIINADLWTKTPRILAANWGFEGIMGIPGLNSVADVNRAVLAGAGVNGDYAKLTPTPPLRNITSGGSPLGVMAGGFGAAVAFADAFPIEFSWPLLPSSVSPTDFAIHLNNGTVVTPQATALNPNYDYNERHVVVMLGEFGNRLKPGTPGAIYPVSVEIVKDSTPLQAVGPNGPQSVVGLTQDSVNPFVVGPGLVGARLSRFSAVGDFAPANLSSNSPNDGASLYKGQATYRLRLFTWGGFSPDGVSSILPTEFSRFFRLQATNAAGQTVAITKDGVSYDLGAGLGTVKVVGLAELGRVADGKNVVYGPYYQEDHDNYVDIILTGDEAAVRRLTSVAIPTSAEAGYADLYDPGGPGRTPTAGYTYTAPARPQTLAIDMTLDGTGTVSYAAQKVASYDRADGLPVVFRLRNPVLYDTVYTASSKQAAALMVQGYVEQGAPFSNEQNSLNLVSVREFYSAAHSDHLYTANASEITRLSQSGSGYVDNGAVFTAIGEYTVGSSPIYRFYSSSLGEHVYTPLLTEGFTSTGYAYEGIAWYSAALMPGLTGDILYDRSDDLSFYDVLSGSGSLTKQGAGTLTLTGNNTLSGATTVSAGTLRVDGGLSQSAITLARGATLSGTGTIGSLVANGEVSPGGTSVGTLTAAGPVTFGVTSTFAADISPTSSDRLAIKAAAALPGGNLRLTALDGSYAAGTTYDLITATGGITGGFSAIELKNPERLAGLVLNVHNTGAALRLGLGTSAVLTEGSDLIAYWGQSLTSGLSGLGADDTLAFLGAGNQLRGGVTGSGRLVVGSADGVAATLNLLSGAQSFSTVTTQSNATLSVNSSLTAPAMVNAGTLGGSGTITGMVLNTGAIAPGNSPGVLTVNGSVSDFSTSTLRIEIDGPTAGNGAGFHDRINVAGSPGVFVADGTLIPTLRGFTEADASPYTPVLDQRFTVVDATGGVAGTFTSVTQPGDGLPAGTRLDVIYGGKTIDLVVTPSSYAGMNSLTANQRATAGAFDRARPAAGVRSGNDSDTLFDAFYAMGTPAAAAALDQLSGVVHAETLTATLGTTRSFGDTLISRAAAVRRGGLETAAQPLTSFSVGMGNRGTVAATSPSATGGGTAAGETAGEGGFIPGAIPGARIWARAMGQFAKVDSDGNAGGQSATTGGLTLGMDAAAAPGWTMGLGFGYFSTDVRTNAHLGKADVGSYAAGVYTTYQAGDMFVDGALSYTYSDYDSRRSIRFGAIDRTATGAAQGNAFGGALTVGYSHRLERGVIEPAASVRYDHIGRNGFNESGAGALGLSVDDQTLQAFRTGLGVRAAWRVDAGSVALEPELRARWDHDFMDTAGASRAALAGQSFGVASSKVGRNAAVLGAGVTTALADRFDAFASYDAELRDGARSQVVMAGMRYRFP